MKSLSCVRLFATPWTIAHQAPLSMEFSRQKYWSRLPFPSPGDLSNPGIELGASSLWADALPSEPPGKSEASLNTHLVAPKFLISSCVEVYYRSILFYAYFVDSPWIIFAHHHPVHIISILHTNRYAQAHSSPL